jgi:hypothetical protein
VVTVSAPSSSRQAAGSFSQAHCAKVMVLSDSQLDERFEHGPFVLQSEDATFVFGLTIQYVSQIAMQLATQGTNRGSEASSPRGV